jgi:uncharacterized cofD-like protein
MWERSTLKWFSIGIGIKRWILLIIIGNLVLAWALSLALVRSVWWVVAVLGIVGIVVITLAFYKLSENLLAPYRRNQHGRVVDIVYAHSRRQKGIKIVAIGGGTGLPSVLRGLKAYTSNITAVVTVADDGGSSGKLRRELGVLPPGDLRNNIVALADDESLMTRLFQYRFNDTGDLRGHSFGNLFIAALSGISGGVDVALTEVERVLNIQGRVLPATLDDIDLIADLRIGKKERIIRVQGESKITDLQGQIVEVSISPDDAVAYDKSVEAILEADLVIIGPGSLYTSILPNLLVQGIADALHKTDAGKVYVCNVATQPGETGDYNVAQHVAALEKYLGEGVLQYVIANNATPPANEQTHYVAPVPEGHEINARYQIYYTDLTDNERPWRHDPQKLGQAIMHLLSERTGDTEYSVPATLSMD